MSRVLLIAIVATCTSAAAAAEEVRPSDADREVRAALEDGASLPATPPELPTTASDQAEAAHRDRAFGKQGAAMRAAHQKADAIGLERAEKARAEAERRAQGDAANDPTGRERGDAARAAARDRAEEARGLSRTHTPVPRGPGNKP